jgi:hypothetical protein
LRFFHHNFFGCSTTKYLLFKCVFKSRNSIIRVQDMPLVHTAWPRNI